MGAFGIFERHPPVENKISEDLVETKDLHLLKPPQRDLNQRCV